MLLPSDDEEEEEQGKTGGDKGSEQIEDWAKDVDYSDDSDDGDDSGGSDDDGGLDEELAALMPAMPAAGESTFMEEIISSLNNSECNPFGIPLTSKITLSTEDGECAEKESEDDSELGEFDGIEFMVDRLRVNQYLLVDPDDLKRGSVFVGPSSASTLEVTAGVGSAMSVTGDSTGSLRPPSSSLLTIESDASIDSRSAVIGRGAFGEVLCAKNKDNGTTVALKRLRKRQLNKKMVMKSVIKDGGIPAVQRCTLLHLVQREVEVMLSFDLRKCAHLTALMEVMDDPTCDELYLVLEYSDLGQVMEWDGFYLRYYPNSVYSESKKEVRICDVSHHASIEEVKQRTTAVEPPRLSFAESQARRLIRCIISALTYLHSSRIIHRDLKPDNLLLFGSGNCCKLCDFGTSERLSEESGGQVNDSQGTIHFFSPNACRADSDGLRNGFKDDVYSLGIVLYCFLVGTVPFHHTAQHTLMDLIANEPLPLPKEHSAVTLSDSARALLNWLLAKEESDRPFVDSVLSHPWFEDFP